MYSILKGEELDESAEETSFAEFTTAESKAPKDWVCPIIVEYMNDRFDKKLLQ